MHNLKFQYQHILRLSIMLIFANIGFIIVNISKITQLNMIPRYFNKIHVKIVKQYVHATFVGFKM
jgi:hypothetical protein